MVMHRRLCRSALAAACWGVPCLATPVWAAPPATGLDVYVQQSMALFDSALLVCDEINAKAAAGMRAELARLKPEVHSAMRKTFADKPELQAPPDGRQVSEAREEMQALSGVVGELARDQGAAFCTDVLVQLKAADATVLVKRLRERYNEFESAIRSSPKP